MSSLRVSFDVTARGARYRAAHLWDDRTLRAGIEAAAAERPDAPALADSRRHLDCRELSWAVAAGVATLHSKDVHAGDVVVLVAGNVIEAVVAYHALLRAGAIAVVLDRRCGAADVRHALDVIDGPPRIIVPDSDRNRLLDDGGVETLALDEFGAVPHQPPEMHWPEPDRDEPAVVLFTSGTTSRPKGVVHSLNTLTAGAANMARITAADEATVAFLVSPVTSIAGIMQTHLAADQHATLVLEEEFEPAASLDRINECGATLLGGAPVIARRLLDAAVQRGSHSITLRTLALGGAMLPRPLLEQATDEFGIHIARVYGSSEAPNFSGSLPSDDRERRLSDDGALMPGSEVRVGSSAHPHEGLLRGPCVCLGYLDLDDSRTAFEGDWLRTGDLVEVHDERLTVTGRLKEVVVRNGLKISLGEIDTALVGVPGVQEHACFAVPDEETGERLAVAVLPDGRAPVTLDTVTAYLVARGTARRKLPEELVCWDVPLPRTASGKVVRSRLQMEAPAKHSERARTREVRDGPKED